MDRPPKYHSGKFPHEPGKVHRGKIDPGRTGLLHKLFPFLSDVKIEGSQADNFRGSRYSDLDVSALRPVGLSDQEIRDLEDKIRTETGVDFYFRDQDDES